MEGNPQAETRSKEDALVLLSSSLIVSAKCLSWARASWLRVGPNTSSTWHGGRLREKKNMLARAKTKEKKGRKKRKKVAFPPKIQIKRKV
jgi:hypothetical protein